MKSAYKYVLVVLFVFIQKSTTAQQIKVGESLPDITFRNVLNHISDTIEFSDLKGKAIIFDFWGFNCVSCLQSFPKLDSLQKQFRDQLQILLVNTESKSETSAFFAKRKKLQMPDVPLVTGDSILQRFFPHTGVPFHIWIDSSGKVSYLTESEYLTSANIQNFLDGIDINLPAAFLNRYQASLFKDEFQHAIQYSTYIAKCIDGGSFHITGLENWGVTINTYYCVSIKDLYQFAYNESDNAGPYKFREPGRTILEVKDKYAYDYPHDASLNNRWIDENGYYYHSILPVNREKTKFKIMQQDLQRYFDLDAKIVQRKVRCLALVRTSSKDKLKTKGGTPASGLLKEDLRIADSSSVKFIKNKPFKYLFDMIKSQGDWVFNIKMVDDSGYKGNIDFEINEKLLENMSIENLRNELKKYHLDLVEKYLLLDVLILKDRR